MGVSNTGTEAQALLFILINKILVIGYIFYNFLYKLMLCISAHPNTVLFITHGGLLSTTEAIHFGKPIIGIPVFADQFINTKRAVSKGFAREVDLSYTMEQPLREAIKEMLSNPQ